MSTPWRVLCVLIHLYIYINRTPVHKTTLHKNFKKARSALTNPNGSLSGRMPSEPITYFTQLIAKCLVSLARLRNVGIGLPRHRAEQYTFINKTRGGYMLVSRQRKAFLPPSCVNPNSGDIWFHVLDEVGTLNYGGRECYATCPRPYTSLYSFAKILFAKSILPLIREIYSPRNIRSLRYFRQYTAGTFLTHAYL